MDGEKIGIIGNGETKEFEVESGKHSLKTKVDWCGSETLAFELTEEESKKVVLAGFKFGKWLMPLALIISVIYFAFGDQLNFKPWMFFLLIISLGLYFVNHLTLGRIRYLKLSEV